MGESRLVEAMALLYRGELEKAQALLKTVHESARRVGSVEIRIWAILQTAEVALRAGTVHEASAWVTAGCEVAERIPHAVDRLRLAVAQARVGLAQDNHTSARNAAYEAYALAGGRITHVAYA